MLKRNASQLVGEANNAVETIPVEEGIALVGDDGAVILDVRETVERQQSGAIKGSVHAARGFLEFHADPDHPKYELLKFTNEVQHRYEPELPWVRTLPRLPPTWGTKST